VGLAVDDVLKVAREHVEELDRLVRVHGGLVVRRIRPLADGHFGATERVLVEQHAQAAARLAGEVRARLRRLRRSADDIRRHASDDEHHRDADPNDKPVRHARLREIEIAEFRLQIAD
jgi:hypothetical protein